MSTIKYRSEIDGLRGVAVTAVVLFHLGAGWLPGGFLGVDVFFVISGFLITSIVLGDLSRGTFRFRDFWARRVRRIMPALLTMVAVTLATVAILGFRGLRPELGKQGLAALLSLANVYFLRQTGNYWGPQAASSPFLHTWSLSVEEQFYLLLPVTLFVLHRKWRKAVLPALVLVIAGSLGVFLFEYAKHPSATFYLLPTRAWELAVGCLLACIPLRSTTSYARGSWLTGLGLSLIAASYVFVETLNAGTVAVVAGAALVLAFGDNGAFKPVLTWRPLAYLGRISYSLYLWHWPWIVLPDQLDWNLSRMTTVVLMLTSAVVSYHLVEQPTRRAARVVPVALGALGATMAGALLLAKSNGVYDIARFDKIRCYGFYFDLKPNNFEQERFTDARAQMDCPPRQVAPDAYLHGGIIVGPRPQSPQIVVLGDSHGTMWSNTLRQIAEARGLTTSFYSMDGVTPFFRVPIVKDQSERFVGGEVKYRFDRARFEHIRAWHPDIVVVATSWLEMPPDPALAHSLLDFLHAEAKQVLLIGQPPVLTFGDRYAAEHLCYLGVQPEGGRELFLPARTDDEYTRSALLPRELAVGYDNVTVVPTAQVFAKGGRSLVLRDDDVVYLDDNHLTDYGAHLAADVLATAIDAAYARIAKATARAQAHAFVGPTLPRR